MDGVGKGLRWEWEKFGVHHDHGYEVWDLIMKIMDGNCLGICHLLLCLLAS